MFCVIWSEAIANTRQEHKTNVMVPKMYENARKAGIFTVTKTRICGVHCSDSYSSEMETFY